MWHGAAVFTCWRRRRGCSRLRIYCARLSGTRMSKATLQVRGRHLRDDLMAELAKQTHLYALEHAADPTPDGWLIFREGIASWWCQAADLTDEEFGRLYMLRTDVVQRLTEQGLAYRRHPCASKCQRLVGWIWY